METNQHVSHNGVHGTSVHNRSDSPGSQVQPGRQEVLEGQGPGGRQQATDHNRGRVEAAEMGSTEARPRKKWTRDENKEAWRCYSMSNPSLRGYRKRMHNIWQERNDIPLTEQRLADQIHGIKKKNWLSVIEREEIERQLNPNERMEDQRDHEEEAETTDPQDNETSHDSNLPAGESNEAPENMEYVRKIKEWMQIGTERTKIPSLKAYNQKKLKEKTKEVNEILRSICTNNITETNNLAYAGARLVVELMEIRIHPKNLTKQHQNIPPWKKRLEQQLTELRADLSKLNEMYAGRLKGKKTKEMLNEKYKIQEKGLNQIIEDVKQRMKAKAQKIQRYTNRNKGYQQNKLFQTNQKRLFSQLRGENNQQEPPEAETSKRLWEGIWGSPVTHNKQAVWLQEIKTEENERIRQRFLEITTTTVRNQLRKIPNWKAPGPDEVHGYWLKNFSTLHSRIAQQLQNCISNHQAPAWMTTGRTALVQKDKNKGNIATNYRPITCLPLMWKLLTGIISERLYNYLEETNTIPHQQKGCRRKCRGTKDQLLIDKMVMMNSRKRKTNLSMAWIDYKKAFDMIPHSWLIECLEIYGAEENTIRFLKNTMTNWKTILTSSGTRLAEVNIKRGIFQGDSLSPLLFILAMIPMTKALEKMEVGYQLKKEGSRINHLMFMDDIKLFGRSSKEIDTLIQTVRIISGDIKMEFGIEKCALINIQRGKVTRTEGIQLPDGNNIKDIDEEGYKYLGIIEGEEIKHQEMKEKVRKEYIKRLRAILKSKLNSGNTVKAINTWAVPVIRYSAGIVDWRKSEIHNLDRKTRKFLNMYQALHPRANVDRLYLPRSEGGKGLLSIEDCVNIEKRSLGQYVKNSEDELLRTAWEENLITEDEEPKIYKENRSKSRREGWKNKTMHGQFLRQTNDLASNDTWQWLQRGELKKETEGMIMAAQDQALRTRYIQRAIDGTNISPKCRKCNEKEETINHITSECPALAQTQYKKRHDTVARAVHWSLCKKYQIPCCNKWYEHQPQAVTENENAKLLWDFGIRTDRVIQAHRPDLTLVDKKNNKVSLIDVAIPWDSRVEQKEREKRDKYQDLRIELRRLWDKPVEIIPIIIGALGTIPKSLKRNLEKVGADVAPGLLQKSVLLETAHIVRKVMDS